MRQIGSKFYNAGKHRLLKGEKLIGSWVQLCSPMSAEILARSGMDFLLIDLEHGPVLLKERAAYKGQKIYIS